MDWLTADWVRCSFSAARENFPSRVTVRNTSSCPKSMRVLLNETTNSISISYLLSVPNTNTRIISFAFDRSAHSIKGWQEGLEHGTSSHYGIRHHTSGWRAVPWVQLERAGKAASGTSA